MIFGALPDAVRTRFPSQCKSPLVYGAAVPRPSIPSDVMRACSLPSVLNTIRELPAPLPASPSKIKAPLSSALI